MREGEKPGRQGLTAELMIQEAERGGGEPKSQETGTSGASGMESKAASER